MKSLIAAGIILTTLLLTVLLSKKNKLFADKFLILYLSFAVLRQIYSYVEAAGVLENSYWMLMGKGLYLLHGPLFFMYVYALTQGRNMSGKYYMTLFLPFVAYTTHFLYYYFFVFDHAQLSVTNGLLIINGQISWSWTFFVLLFIITDPIYLFWFHRILKQYHLKLLSSISDDEGIQLRWLTTLFYLWLIAVIVLVPVGGLTVSVGIISTTVLEIMIEVTAVAFFFVAGFYGFRQTTIFTNPVTQEVAPERMTAIPYGRSGLTQPQAKAYHEKLLKVMEEQKPWLRGDLNAAELAQLAGITVNHLSQVLYSEQHQNFFDFVNGYRVKEVVTRMKDPKNNGITLLAMALDSGFNSKTAFNAVFKKMTQQTPSQYYKSVSGGVKI